VNGTKKMGVRVCQYHHLHHYYLVTGIESVKRHKAISPRLLVA